VLTNPVPGPPAAVLAAILRGGPATGQGNRATFSTTNFPLLPSLMTDVVALSQFAELDADVEITGILVSNGWATQAVVSVTAAYTPPPNVAVVLCDATSAGFTVTLPDATQPGYVVGQRYTIKKTDSTGHAVTVAASAGQLIDGAATQSLTAGNAETSVVFDGADWWVWAGITTVAGNFAQLLTPTAVKTGPYTAAPGDFVPVDTTSSGVTITLPTAPADATIIGIKMVTQGGSNTVTIAAGGSDVFNKSGGAATASLALINQGDLMQYKASTGIWYLYANYLSLTSLDNRYLQLTGGTMTGAIAMGSNKVTGLANGSAAADAAAFGQVPTADATAAHILPAGVQAAGSNGQWADSGHVHQNNAVLSLYTEPTGTTAVTFPRGLATVATGAMTSGTLYVVAIGLPKGLVVNNLTLATKSTALTGLSHGWYVLLDSGLVVRAVTADQTSGAWLSVTNTPYTLATGAYTTTAGGLYYIGVMAAASGMPVMAAAGTMASGLASASPVFCATSSTSQTTPPSTGTTMGALTSAGSFTMYAATS
jgi:hypothetical protein